MTLISLIIFSATALSVTVGTFVLLHSYTRAINQAFFVFSMGVALWIGGYGLILATQDDGALTLLNCGGLILVIGLTRFAQTFPKHSPLPLRPLLFWAPLLLGGTSMIFTNTIVTGVKFLPTDEMEVTNGPLILLWCLLLSTYIGISLYFLIRSYIRSSIEDRDRLWFICVGISLFVLTSIICDAILPGLFGFARLNHIGPLASLIFLFATAYAVLKYEFLDIRVVIQRSLIYTLLFFILAVSYVVLLLVAEHLSEGMIGIAAPVSAGITILIGMYTLPLMEAYFRRITDPFFFKDRYDYFAVLESLSEVLNTNLNLRPLALLSLAVLERTFKPRYSYFIRSENNTCYSHTDCVHAKVLDEEVAHSLRVPVRSASRQIGEYVLGPKRSGEKYTRIDKSLLRTYSGYATVAFEKAELFQKLRDHTEHLEEKVDERTKHLKQLQERQREFFDDISHALQTPLTVLRSGIELLRKSAQGEDTRIYTSMDTSIEDLSRLIRSILQLARIDTYSSDTEMSVLNLKEVVSGIAEYVCIVAETAGITLTSDLGNTPVTIYGNKRQLEEVCTNLLSNAVKYTAGAQRKSIHLSLFEDSGSAILCVKDTGMGMTSDQLAKIFERFYRTEQAGKSNEGYGLGLAITKRIIERHAGSISFQSNPGEGTCVTVTLPVGVLAEPQPQTLL
jgi:signal transduction histidine kinase